MSLQIGPKELQRVKIVDDDRSARLGYEYTVEELDLLPVQETGPVRDLSGFLNNTINSSDAAICDHHLIVSNYSDFEGSVLVANLYEKQFPAILCTRWEEADIDELRQYRRRIPVLLKPNELTPERLEEGFKTCIREFDGDYQPIRRPWRTLVRVEDKDPERDKGYIFLVMSTWDNNSVIRVLSSSVPEEIWGLIQQGKTRFHVQVNIGAERHEDLFFEQWETT